MRRRQKWVVLALLVAFMNLGMVQVDCTNSIDENIETITVITASGFTDNRNALQVQFGRLSINQQQEEIFVVENSVNDDDPVESLSFQQIMPPMPYWSFLASISPDEQVGFWIQSPEEIGGFSRIPDHYVRGYISDTDKDQDGPRAVWPVEI